MSDPNFAVGAEVDSVCGPCTDVRTHVVIALAGERPPRVQCRSCGALHNYRKPVAQRIAEEKVQVKQLRVMRRGQIDDPTPEIAADTPKTLQEELRDAAEIRPYDRHNRYRVGEIIEHPEYGRGKVETRLRGHMIVRFLSGGKTLKSR